MHQRTFSSGTKQWRKALACVGVVAVLVLGIRLHALSFNGPVSVTSNIHRTNFERNSFLGDGLYWVAPEPSLVFLPSVSLTRHLPRAEDPFIPVHLDGQYFNRPPPRH